MGVVTEVSLGLGAAALVAAAAAACIIARTRRRSACARRDGPERKLAGRPDGMEPLLPLLGSGGGGSGARLTAGAAPTTEAPAVMAQRLQLSQEAEYDPQTGFPQNMAAKQLAALNWRTGLAGTAAGAAGLVVALPFAELAQATHNFDAFNALGTGGSCDVFKGHVFGLQVAVKRLNAGGSAWAEEQFTCEMELLTRIAHPNVISLYAFSTDGPNRLLVLQLCTGGALNDRLSCKAQAGSAPPPPLRWQQRLHIAQGILEALEFLHGLTPQMIHRDLKTPNVLLDASGNAKVADFGTVRMGVAPGAGTRVTHRVTKNAVGTRGYMAPEYHDHGQLSSRTDVYSFGVVLLELLMGLPAREVVGMLFDDRDFFDRMQEYKDPRAGAWPKNEEGGEGAGGRSG
jgi:hypothetical protein